MHSAVATTSLLLSSDLLDAEPPVAVLVCLPEGLDEGLPLVPVPDLALAEEDDGRHAVAAVHLDGIGEREGVTLEEEEEEEEGRRRSGRNVERALRTHREQGKEEGRKEGSKEGSRTPGCSPKEERNRDYQPG